MGELDRILRQASELHDSGRFQDALALYEDALACWPTLALIWNNRGNTLLELGQFEQATQSYLQALELAPTLHDSRIALSSCWMAQGELQQAMDACLTVMKAVPDHAEAHWNYALLLLLQDDYAAGFREYEWRWKKRRFSSPVRTFEQPRWYGESLTGKTILVYAEQGFGDTLQFCRYLLLLAEQQGRIVFECHTPLVRLMQQLDIPVTVVPFGCSLPHFDTHVPLLSLPALFGTTVTSVPSDMPYLRAPNELNLFWQSVVPQHSSGKKVGICWAGKLYPDPNRSCPVEYLEPLGDLPGIAWYSLQVGEKRESPPFVLTDLTMLIQDFADTAALIMQLDLVITIDSAVAHLAGALGKETWVLVPFAPDWRWGLERTDCPWYLGMRLFRQQAPGAWDGVIDVLVNELK